MPGPDDLVGPCRSPRRCGSGCSTVPRLSWTVCLRRRSRPVRAPLDTSLGVPAVVLRPGRRVRGRAEHDLGPGQVADEPARRAADAARLYQASCGHVFGDAMCGYDRTAGKNAVGAATGIGAVTIVAQPDPPGADRHDLQPEPGNGLRPRHDDGLLGRQCRREQNHCCLAGGIIHQLKPWLSPVAVGDTFQLLPGCDHTTAPAASPEPRPLRRFPYVPPPESAA